jgi:hypothetical protein
VGLPNKHFCRQIPSRGHWHLDEPFGLIQRVLDVSRMQGNVGKQGDVPPHREGLEAGQELGPCEEKRSLSEIGHGRPL